jgi:hypothetical protein
MKQSQSQHPHPTPSLFHLFTSFLRLGATAFGDPAMVAYIRKMAVEKKHWLGDQSARDLVTGLPFVRQSLGPRRCKCLLRRFESKGNGGRCSKFHRVWSPRLSFYDVAFSVI